MANTLGTINPLRYRGYVYDQETGLYYLQSRYYDPEIGRFINGDALASTGQGFVGNNMFAYCYNNPVNLVDPAGTIPFADHFYSDAVVAFGSMIGDWARTMLNIIKNPKEEVAYESSPQYKGAEIAASYTVMNPITMYQYIEENRGEEIKGTTIGVVHEWVVHDVAYAGGELLVSLGFTNKGEEIKLRAKDLDIGHTIYDDDHGIASYLIWGTYAIRFPWAAGYDLYIKIFE